VTWLWCKSCSRLSDLCHSSLKTSVLSGITFISHIHTLTSAHMFMNRRKNKFKSLLINITDIIRWDLFVCLCQEIMISFVCFTISCKITSAGMRWKFINSRSFSLFYLFSFLILCGFFGENSLLLFTLLTVFKEQCVWILICQI
jgi:hypothetical protein